MVSPFLSPCIDWTVMSRPIILSLAVLISSFYLTWLCLELLCISTKKDSYSFCTFTKTTMQAYTTVFHSLKCISRWRISRPKKDDVRRGGRKYDELHSCVDYFVAILKASMTTVPPKRRCPTTTLYGVIAQNASTFSGYIWQPSDVLKCLFANILYRVVICRPTQPPVQWVPGAFPPRVKRSGREFDHSSPSSAEVKTAWKYTSTPQYVFMAWCLIKQWLRLHGAVLS